MSECAILATTTPSPEVAQQIATSLVEQRLAACVHVVGPIQSTFRWQDKIETAEEWRIEAKTRATLIEAASLAIRAIHPYEVPEILVTAIDGLDADYLDWLLAETIDPG